MKAKYKVHSIREWVGRYPVPECGALTGSDARYGWRGVTCKNCLRRRQR